MLWFRILARKLLVLLYWERCLRKVSLIEIFENQYANVLVRVNRKHVINSLNGTIIIQKKFF